METRISFTPSATFTLVQLADLFTRSFEGYFYSAITTADQLAQRIRVESIDLWHSPVLLVNGEPAGLALIGLRGERAWCGGFGIITPRRGLGYGAQMAQEMLNQARSASASTFILEVLTKNERAIRTYQSVGMKTVRDLQIFEWRRPLEWGQRIAAPPLVRRSQAGLHSHFAALHPVPAAWQRELASLLGRNGGYGLTLEESGPLNAYAICSDLPSNGLRITDLAARDVLAARTLLSGLQARAERIISVNEPDDSPLSAAFVQAGFSEIDRQHEMVIEL